jgi:hypothetical protein
MPTIKIQNQNIDLSYYLIAFDKDGKERTDDAEGLMSQKVADILAQEPVTDVFIFSHGWLGDVPAAISQYNRWIGVMAEQTQDIERLRQIRPGFRPLLIGLHWPSLPFGEEALGISGSPVSFATTGAPAVDPIEQMVEFYSNAIADTDRAKTALRTIITSAAENSAPSVLPYDAIKAYKKLEQEADLSQDGMAGAPGADREPFNPERQYLLSKNTPVDFAGPNWSQLLAPLRTLSFWKMKDRARAFGESGGFNLLTKLQQATNDQVRFHLMGHSFGCIVVTAMLCGTKDGGQLPRPVNSVALVQGALSIWSYCADIPYQKGTPGYFRRLIEPAKVNGPVLTTQSERDTALSKMYPLGAGVAAQVSFNPGELPPKYAAVGTFGIRGDKLPLEFLDMLPVNQSYSFSPGVIYNLESSSFINQRSGPGGAHNDITKPEVAHAIWCAAMS